MEAFYDKIKSNRVAGGIYDGYCDIYKGTETYERTDRRN